MTYEEKLMNKVDLHNYKTGDAHHFEAMIPGIYNLNTVGSTPLVRGAKQILNTNRASTDFLKDQGDINSNKTLGFNKSMKFLPAYMEQTNNTIHNDIKEEITKKKEVDIQPDRYNPITNPIPWMNHNPYINKDKTLAKSSSVVRTAISIS